MRQGIEEKRTEARLWCSDLIKVRVEDAQNAELTGNLEDISPSGACVQLEQPVEVGARVCLMLQRRRFKGQVRYCVKDEIGYFAGIQFDTGRLWSRKLYTPKHLLDPARLVKRKR